MIMKIEKKVVMKKIIMKRMKIVMIKIIWKIIFNFILNDFKVFKFNL